MIGIGITGIVVCLLPWLAFLRRKISSGLFPESAGWMCVVRVLLWMAIVSVPAATGLVLIYNLISGSNTGWEWLVVLLIGSFAFYLACVPAMTAIGIQLWRDKWCPVLTAGVVCPMAFYLFDLLYDHFVGWLGVVWRGRLES